MKKLFDPSVPLTPDDIDLIFKTIVYALSFVKLVVLVLVLVQFGSN